jgi:hypothetical protein
VCWHFSILAVGRKVRGDEVGHKAVHECHEQGMRRPLGQTPKPVAVSDEVSVGCDLGHFRAKFGRGPKGKVEAHARIYKFRLRCKVISVPD